MAFVELHGNVRFEDRKLTTHDNGGDFERFTLEIIPHIEPGLTVRGTLALGRDGAIDLLGTNSGGAMGVIECKFIGQDASDDAGDRWRAVEKHLETNLPLLAAKPAKSPNSPYHLWLLPEKPVSYYYFCVTRAMNHLEVSRLTARIQKLFKTLAALPGLTHLAALGSDDKAVRVVPWDQFHQTLHATPALLYRWFGGLPKHIELLSDDGLSGLDTANITFNDFLRGDVLPFFSRSEFLRQTGARTLQTETGLVQRLTGADAPQALVVHGPGGVGKTRLSLELARDLHRLGWLTVKMGPKASGDSVEDLLRSHPQTARVAFLLDYAEAAPHLPDVAEAIRQGCGEGNHQALLIVTCRGSAQAAVEDALAGLTFDSFALDAEPGPGGGQAYTKWVAEQILIDGKVPNPAAILPVCDYLPALATFAIYLHRRFRKRFNEQFSALHDIQDYGTWVAVRARHLLGSKGNEEGMLEALADLALSLPMPVAVRDAIHQQGGLARDILARLEDDRWVEPASEAYVAAHDVLADSLAAYALLREAAKATRRLSGALLRAAGQDRLMTAMTATDRLTRLTGWDRVDGLEVARTLARTQGAALLNQTHQILRGGLLDLPGKIELARTWRPFQQRVEDDRNLDFFLSALAEQAAKVQAGSPLRTDFLAVFGPALHRAATWPRINNMVLRRAYHLDPVTYRPSMLAHIARHPEQSETHFLLTAMLKAGEPPANLTPAVTRWLDAGGAHDIKASFVLSAWLDAKGSVELVADPVAAWLERHAQIEGAQFVYTSWLNAGGPIKLVGGPVAAWLEQHAQIEAARFVYTSWLKAKGPVELVADPITAWLERYAQSEAAQFVYTSWLNAKGPVKLVEGPVSAWLERYAQSDNADFVIRAWLDAKGPVELVSDPVAAWLERYAQSDNADFVIRAWLDAKGPVELVSAPITAWLERHAQSDNADYVIRAWLKAGGAFDRVRGAALDWLHAHTEQESAVFITKQLSMLPDLPETALHDISRWVTNFPENEDAIFRIRPISRRLTDATIDLAVREAIAQSAHQALDCIFARTPVMWGASPGARQSAVTFTIQNLCEDAALPHLRAKTRQLTAQAVACGAVFTPGTKLFIFPAVLHMVADALAAGDLDHHRDATGLSAFAGLLATQPVQDIALLNILADIVRDHPHPLWQNCQDALRRSLR